MLAQNFKTAEELHITEIERDALIKVLGMLERDELKRTSVGKLVPNGFNMADRWRRNQCGTACCIMGWADIVAGETLPFNPADFPLNELFIPPGCSEGRHTPAQAAIALRNYLTHGEPRWDEALAAVE